jgi:DNA-binding HxlR family transcriptional regulator
VISLVANLPTQRHVVVDTQPSEAGPTRELLARMSNKRVVMILELLAGTSDELRFSELLRATRGASSKMLSATLHDLVRDGLVMRRVEEVVPQRVYYGLSDLGQSLLGPLEGLKRWANNNMSSVEQRRRAYDAANTESPLHRPLRLRQVTTSADRTLRGDRAHAALAVR